MTATPGGLRLTPAGAILLEHADAIAARFQLARSQLADIARGERSRLRIGAFPTALAGLVPAAVARLHDRHPEARITVGEGTGELTQRVRSGALHLALAVQDVTVLAA